LFWSFWLPVHAFPSAERKTQRNTTISRLPRNCCA
jgi:hypothetical protein